MVKFKTSDNLISLLVGQNLYSSGDAALRELLQNAEDACNLMTISDPSFSPEINIQYSVSQNYFEISDNGLGMDQEIFEESFLTIGASKSNSTKLQALLKIAGDSVRPIGQFGIGILSCFGVAETVQILTLAEDADPLSFTIPDLRGEFNVIDEHLTQRGTTVRIYFKQDGPMSAANIPSAVSRYVRHANNIWMKNVDDGQRDRVPEQWLIDPVNESGLLTFDMISQGRLQLSNAWENINQGLEGQITICNGGFLVTDNARDILPDYAVGFRGEIDVRPGSMTILLNREGFQKDQHWEHFCEYVKIHYQKLVKQKLDDWIAEASPTKSSLERIRAIQRIVLLILRSPLGNIVGEPNKEKAQLLIPRALYNIEREYLSVDNIVSIAQKKPPLYVYRTDDDQTLNRNLTDRGQNIQFSAPIRSLNLRTTLLQLNGFVVVEAEKHTYTVFYRGRNRNVEIHDFQLLEVLAAARGFEIGMVKDAPADHTRIGTSSDAREITSIFGLESDLKIQSVDAVAEAVIADFNGYILNSKNEDIQQILAIIPDAVGNPIRKNIVAAYFSLSVYDVVKSRKILYDLIVDKDFHSKARQLTGKYFRLYLTDKIQNLLQAEEEEDV